MIEASKVSWFDKLFFHYNLYYLLRRHFHSIGIQGDLDSATSGNGPVLYVMNHSSWWDGLLVYHAFRTSSDGDHYVMMDEKQMRHYPFFRKLGAFSIDKETRTGMLRSLRYAASLLQSGRRVWVYPQGDIYHLEHRPIEYQPGITYLLKQCPEAIVIPVTAYYSLHRHQKTEATLVVGQPIHDEWSSMTKLQIMQQIGEKLSSQLELHRNRIIYDGGKQHTVYFRSLLRSRRSTNETFDAVKKKVNAWKSFFGLS